MERGRKGGVKEATLNLHNMRMRRLGVSRVLDTQRGAEERAREMGK